MFSCRNTGFRDYRGAYGQVRRRATGVDGNRLTMIAAVLEQHAGLQLTDQDIYAGSVGGLRHIEPAIDLALCMAVMGACIGHAVPYGMCAIGEIGLGGEVRAVPHIEHRVVQAKRRGYEQNLVPITQISLFGSGAIPVATMEDLLGLFRKNNEINRAEKLLSDSEKTEVSLEF